MAKLADMNLDQPESRLSGNNLWATALNLVGNANSSSGRKGKDGALEDDADDDVNEVVSAVTPVKSENVEAARSTGIAQAA